MKVRNLVTAGALAIAAAGSTAAGAQEYVDYVGTSSPQLDSGNLAEETAVLGTTRSRDALPVTGGDVAGLAVLGAGAVGLGFVLIRNSKSRTSGAA